MNADRDSMGCRWHDLHGAEAEEVAKDVIAYMTFAEKCEAWTDWDDARKTPFRPQTRLPFRDWLIGRTVKELDL